MNNEYYVVVAGLAGDDFVVGLVEIDKALTLEQACERAAYLVKLTKIPGRVLKITECAVFTR